jgi:hypothetical protein
MALGSIMLQLVADQELDAEVSEVAPFFAEVFEFLSLGKVTVREVSMEKMGGIYGGNSATPIDDSTTGFATLRLLFPSGKEEVFFLAPSHVPSPQIAGAGLAILEIRDTGFKSAANNLQVARSLGAHAYLDEV